MRTKTLVLSLALAGIFAAQAQEGVQLMNPGKHPSRALVERGVRQAGGERAVWLFNTAVIFPHLAVGPEWETSFVIVNMSTASAEFNLGFFTTAGEPMTVRYVKSTGGAATTGAVLTETLARGGSITVTVQDDGQPLRTGFAILEPPSDEQRLGGYAVFRQRVAGRPD